MKKHRWQKGDLIQVALPVGFRYLQLVGVDAALGFDVFRVLDLETSEPNRDPALLGSLPTQYWFQSFRTVLAKDSRFTFVGKNVDAGDLPPLRRRFVNGWIVVHDGSERFVPNPITDEVARISLEEGLPAQLIVDRLASNWRPEQERGDVAEEMQRDRATAPATGRQLARETTFFIDFPSNKVASEARQKLAKHGFIAKHEHRKESLAVMRPWKDGDSLDAMDLLELELLEITLEFKGTISGRETSI